MAMGKCSVDGCDREGKLTLGMCSAHYQRNRRYGDPSIRKRRPPGGCTVEGCERAARHVGYCPMHARRADRNGGDPGGAEPKRRCTAAIGDRHTLATGYVRVKIGHEHPRAYASGWILEHILVMEEKLGRRLLPGENVHHINGRRDDNRPENLELWVTMQPAGQRPSDMLAWAQEVIRRYGDET